jgi:glycogen(starch) synthase
VKILCYSPAFHPSMGGLETVMEMLAEGFARHGHTVRLVSTTPDDGSRSFSFEIIRSPGVRDLLRLLRWADVYFQGNISLKGLWPLLLVRRPVVVSHQGWYCTRGTPCAFRQRIKHWVTRFAINTACSEAVAPHIPAPCTVIPNGYRDDLFSEMPEIRRHRDLVFLGRLVSDKGADMLPQALASLRDRGLTPALTIVGSGPEEPKLREQVRALRLGEQVRFAGVVRGRALAELLNLSESWRWKASPAVARWWARRAVAYLKRSARAA